MTNAAVWLRVSIGHQDSDNQVQHIERFAAHHGHEIAERCEPVVLPDACKEAVETGHTLS